MRQPHLSKNAIDNTVPPLPAYPGTQDRLSDDRRPSGNNKWSSSVVQRHATDLLRSVHEVNLGKYWTNDATLCWHIARMRNPLVTATAQKAIDDIRRMVDTITQDDLKRGYEDPLLCNVSKEASHGDGLSLSDDPKYAYKGSLLYSVLEEASHRDGVTLPNVFFLIAGDLDKDFHSRCLIALVGEGSKFAQDRADQFFEALTHATSLNLENIWHWCIGKDWRRYIKTLRSAVAVLESNKSEYLRPHTSRELCKRDDQLDETKSKADT